MPAPSKGDKLRGITDAAAAQMRQKIKDKEEKAEAKQTELVRQAAMEHLRIQFGDKKVTPTPAPLKDKLEKACKCSREVRSRAPR